MTGYKSEKENDDTSARRIPEQLAKEGMVNKT